MCSTGRHAGRPAPGPTGRPPAPPPPPPPPPTPPTHPPPPPPPPPPPHPHPPPTPPHPHPPPPPTPPTPTTPPPPPPPPPWRGRRHWWHERSPTRPRGEQPHPAVAAVPTVARRLRRLRNRPADCGLPVRQGVRRREPHDRRHRPQAGGAHHRPAHDGQGRRRRHRVRGLARSLHRTDLLPVRHREHARHGALDRPHGSAVRPCLEPHRIRGHPGSARLLRGLGGGRDALRGARRAPPPGARAGAARRASGAGRPDPFA